MIKTFTYGPDLHVERPLKEKKIPFTVSAEPSKNVLATILNFSKNLEIKHSKFLPPIELIRS